MGESEDPIYRIISRKYPDYSLTIRGGYVVLTLTHPFDRYQHWIIKDEKHGATIKDSEGQPAFAVINRATGQAICHGPNSQPVPLEPYNKNSFNESVLWTMSKDVYEGFKHIRRADLISDHWVVSGEHYGHIMMLSTLINESRTNWKFEKVKHSSCITLFRPSQHTVKIIWKKKVGHNLAIHKDGKTVLLVPSNPKDKYQHWIKEMAYGVPVKDEKGQEAFALVNMATGKAIKYGFGRYYHVQVAPFNRNCMDPSLLWTESSEVSDHGFRQIRMQNNIEMSFSIFKEHTSVDCPLLGLSQARDNFWDYLEWKIENFE